MFPRKTVGQKLLPTHSLVEFLKKEKDPGRKIILPVKEQKLNEASAIFSTMNTR